jgi:hypothetical protein
MGKLLFALIVLASRDKPYSMLKPGQQSLKRDYYHEVTQEKPDGEVVLKNFSRFQSIYDQSCRNNVKLGDYKVPAKSMNTMVSYELIHNPSLFNSTKLGRDLSGARTSSGQVFSPKSGLNLTSLGPKVSNSITPAAHWGSTYKKISNEVAEGPWNQSKRPMWSINRTAYSSGRCNYLTEFQDTIGKHGHNPRDILGFNSDSHPNKENELTVGTTKVTCHIPGYNGFIPQTDMN